MKKLLLQILLFCCLVFISAIWVFSNADGYTDHSYLRFTTPSQTSMILGTSKSAQGLLPEEVNNVLGRTDLFNYSFNAFISPFGKTYLESIKCKLDPSTKNGIFIITYDAWSLGSKTENPNDSANFRELKGCLTNSFVSLNPNIPYMIKFFDKKKIDIFREAQRHTFLHMDGWLEVTLDLDSLFIERAIANNIKHYNKIYTPFWKYSSLRFKYFSRTIKFLKNYGKVFLVRLPTRREFLEMENNVLPNLDQKVDSLAQFHNVVNLNFADSSDNYIFTDGIHLWKESGRKISNEIAQQILKYSSQNEH